MLFVKEDLDIICNGKSCIRQGPVTCRQSGLSLDPVIICGIYWGKEADVLVIPGDAGMCHHQCPNVGHKEFFGRAFLLICEVQLREVFQPISPPLLESSCIALPHHFGCQWHTVAVSGLAQLFSACLYAYTANKLWLRESSGPIHKR